MPAVTETVLNQSTTVTEVTLGASGNTVTYKPGAGQILVIRNPTGGAIAPTIIGDAATSVPSYGAAPVTTSAGLALGSIAAGATKAVPLDSISAYLVGNITITGANTLVASLLVG